MRDKDLRELDRESEALVKNLGLPKISADAREFCQELERTLGRPIALVEYDFLSSAPEITGLRVATPSREYIFFERDTDEWLQNHTILHEVGHILWGHDPDFVSDSNLFNLADVMKHAEQVEGLDPDFAEHWGVWQRNHRDSRVELEAEAIAEAIERLGEPSVMDRFVMIQRKLRLE